MNFRSIFRYLLFGIIPVADTGTILIVAHYFGALLALLLVLVSSLTGVAMCGRYLKRMKAHSDQLKEQHHGSMPRDVQLITAYDALITLVLMFMFIYPGLLSDFIAFILLIPRFQKSFYNWWVVGLKKEAERQGKTLEELLTPKCPR